MTSELKSTTPEFDLVKVLERTDLKTFTIDSMQVTGEFPIPLKQHTADYMFKCPYASDMFATHRTRWVTSTIGKRKIHIKMRVPRTDFTPIKTVSGRCYLERPNFRAVPRGSMDHLKRGTVFQVMGIRGDYAAAIETACVPLPIEMSNEELESRVRANLMEPQDANA